MDKMKKSNKFKVELRSLLGNCERPPFLFIGSGISIRYKGIPTWLSLLDGFVGEHKECFKYEFGYYSSKCSNNPLQIATILASEFHEFWWKEKRYTDSRKKYSNISGLHPEMAFKIELCQFVQTQSKVKSDLRSEIKLMSQAVVSGILTTNWDDFLEKSFGDFQVQIGQKEAIFADYKSIGELYKVHGCISRPESLVVTQKDYDDFIANNYYLNAKLLTIFADFPILFMGYSLSDPNIELILKNLISCLDKDFIHTQKLQGRLFFVEWSSEPTTPRIEQATYTSDSITIPLTKLTIHEYSSVWEVLSQLPRTLPVKLLRQLQGMVFDFVSTATPTRKVLVHGVEDLNKIEDLEVVVGFGTISKMQEKGIIGLNKKDLLRDILFNDLHPHNYQEIVEKLLPSVVKKNVYVPFFKYNRETGNLNKNNSLKKFAGTNFTLTRSHKITIDDYRIDSGKTRITKIVDNFETFADLLTASTAEHLVQWIPYCEKSTINIDELRQFLKLNWPQFGDKKHKYSSHYRKCICLLDYLENAY
ncbi:SIR2 family protein [uncultured Psychroserpens sp.]|uniref:SIR2 family protein n=1 Tax=uncultured Psychroserpens sp. TaxID=255436 RepID=UPI002618D80F|nr:SIR2 family protein [uncultured Psychroserpens sp.]